MDYFGEMTYVLENQLLSEELFFLKSLYYLQDPSLLNSRDLINVRKNIEKYYSNRDYEWVTMINKLIKKNFITDFRKESEKHENKIDTEKIVLLDKFKDTFFLDMEVAYEQAQLIYPRKIKVYNTDTMSGGHEDLKLYYYQKIIAFGDKALHARFVEITKLKFDYSDKHAKPLKKAEVGWKKYLETFNVMSREWEEELKKSKPKSSWRDNSL